MWYSFRFAYPSRLTGTISTIQLVIWLKTDPYNQPFPNMCGRLASHKVSSMYQVYELMLPITLSNEVSSSLA